METLSFNESSLVLACKKGVSTACGQLYQAYVTQVYRFVYLRTRHKETAEDITSETFLKAFAHFENFDTNRLLLPWLYRIAHNALIDHWRKERPGFSLDENWDSPSEDPTPLEVAVTSEKNKEALALLEKLNPLEKTVVTLRLWDQLSYREIASVTDKTEDYAKVIFSRAMSKLRKQKPQ